MKYIKLFRLALDPVTPSPLASLVYMRGHRILMKRGQSVAWPLALSPEEMKMGRRELWDKYVGPALREIGDAGDADWPPAVLKKYDQVTFLEFLRRQGPTPDALALLRLGFADQLGDGADAVSALDLIRESAQRSRMSQYFTVRGGSDLLPQAFATLLADKIRYGAPVVRIEHDPQGVRVVCSQADGRHTFSADHLVCALPFPCLRRIEIAPRFPPAKQQAIEELQLTSVTRVYLQTSKRFWVDEGLSGSAITDLPVQTLYHHNPNQSETTGARGILESYTAGPQARLLAKMKESERLGTTFTEAQKVYPAIRNHFEGGASHSWDEDEWARGAYTWFRPGQMTSLLPNVARPEGRVHFAGEHASNWPGWMQGALEAGNRVAREINETP
jgi:monoamine oxidase